MKEKLACGHGGTARRRRVKARQRRGAMKHGVAGWARIDGKEGSSEAEWVDAVSSLSSIDSSFFFVRADHGAGSTMSIVAEAASACLG
ncbi:hypothetical protein M0R45_035323 [Rubus argutus]|uniref:Uncharacterized protein n=1 Tax=Rubus argutus TaxID=59490 RepID=A0AAW1VWL5_RUBAR